MNALVQASSRQVEAAVAQASAEQKQYLTFMLGGEMFAIGILAIKEIIEYGGLTEVPMMPAERSRGIAPERVEPAERDALPRTRDGDRRRHRPTLAA